MFIIVAIAITIPYAVLQKYQSVSGVSVGYHEVGWGNVVT